MNCITVSGSPWLTTVIHKRIINRGYTNCNDWIMTINSSYWMIFWVDKHFHVLNLRWTEHCSGLLSSRHCRPSQPTLRVQLWLRKLRHREIWRSVLGVPWPGFSAQQRRWFLVSVECTSWLGSVPLGWVWYPLAWFAVGSIGFCSFFLMETA